MFTFDIAYVFFSLWKTRHFWKSLISSETGSVLSILLTKSDDNLISPIFTPVDVKVSDQSFQTFGFSCHASLNPLESICFSLQSLEYV
jgi:hypothetical protein